MFLRRGKDVENVGIILERTNEHDETILNETVHERRLVIPASVLAQAERPVPRTASFDANRAVIQRVSHSLEQAAEVAQPREASLAWHRSRTTTGTTVAHQ